MRAFAPNGLEIEGTLETVLGVALTQDFKRNADGTLDFNYWGETRIFWDEQRTVMENGQRLFVDEEGNTWPENAITLKGGDDND